MTAATLDQPQEKQAPPPVPQAGGIAERIATAKAVGYAPGVPDAPAETCRDIERIVYSRLGWER